MKRFLSILIGLLLGANVLAQGEYSLKAAEAPLGSHIKPEAARNARFPLNKKYQDFTLEEKQAFKALYEPMAEDDEPPFPREGLKGFILDLSNAVTARHAEGPLILVARVAADGTVDKVDILESPPDKQLARYAAIRLGRLQFKPAKCGDKACVMDFPFVTQLTLR